MTNLDEYIKTHRAHKKVLHLSPLAQQILEERYLLRDKEQKIIESPLEMYIRVAKTMALQEKTLKSQICWFNLFLTGLIRQEWCVASPGLMNAGTKLQQLSACFILEIEDNLEDIFNTLKNAALIYKSGGGVGFYFGKLREKEALIESTNGVSSGIFSWLKLYDTAINSIAQGGKRRGAALGLLPINHPDIFTWLEAKENEKQLTNFNLSVSIDDDFMKALHRDEEISLVSPLGYITSSVPARVLWDKLCSQAWKNGEPGIFFVDRANRDNANPHLGRINCSNPCGEFTNINYSSCNLASINLEKHLNFEKGTYRFDWQKFSRTIKIVQRFLDNMIDANELPLPQLQDIAQKTRPQGLGFMGLARTLKALGLGYHTERGRQWVNQMVQFLRKTAEEASIELASERGVYPAWRGSRWEKEGKALRNSCLLAIAPTGTIATLCNTSWGLEPDFAPIYRRNILGGQSFLEIDPQLIEAMKKLDIDTPELRQKIYEEGSIQNIKEFPPALKDVFVYARDIKLEDHIKMQAVIQTHVDGACSKTINLPHNATVEDVDKALKLAHQLGLKGCTVYRDKSRQEQVLDNCSLNTSCSECQV
ncbi:MAG: adenosylcobalamin-dependent ribonucleoside-diphosphate reductase [Clostridia bacterium]|nr:adenosylcobalamin-dependent ribonucleoside-diphosphate reductase [Clostridia bacterium]